MQNIYGAHQVIQIYFSPMRWQSMRDHHYHYSDVTMSTIASQITSLTIVYSTVYSGADERKHQSSASLAFVRGFHRGPVNSPHKGPVTRKMFPFDDVIMRSIFLWIFNLVEVVGAAFAAIKMWYLLFHQTNWIWSVQSLGICCKLLHMPNRISTSPYLNMDTIICMYLYRYRNKLWFKKINFIGLCLVQSLLVVVVVVVILLTVQDMYNTCKKKT